MWLKFLPWLFLLTACFKGDSIYQIRDGRIYIKPVPVEVVEATPQRWLVGKLRRDKITRSIFIKLALPRMSEELLLKLSEEKVNAILIKVQRQANSRTSTMGYIYVPLFKMHRGTTPKPADPAFVFVSVSYAAASISKRMSSKACPAFGHKKKIVKWELRDVPRYRSEIIIIHKGALAARAGRNSLEPYSFNGGNSLRGEYFFSMAYYNFERKEIYSEFIPFDKSLVIQREEDQSVSGCP